MHSKSARKDNFRSPASVVMKLMNFRSIDPNYGGKGLAAGSRLDQAVWTEFVQDKGRLSTVASAIRTILGHEKMLRTLLTAAYQDEQAFEADEGTLLTRLHHFRERNPRLVASKKKAAFEQHESLMCEACGFCFKDAYGDLGETFIECHHRKPLSEIVGRRTTSIEDLALLCANCHRMIHARRPWLTVAQLQAIVAAQIRQKQLLSKTWNHDC